MSDTVRQIKAYVNDSIRSSVPSMELDEVFIRKDEVAVQVKQQVQDQMQKFGFNILSVLIIEIQPDVKVKAAMNEINAAARLKLAAREKAQAEKIQIIKAAEAHAETLYLEGLGLSNYRKNIIKGLSQTVQDLQADLNEVSSKEVSHILMLTQYFDMLKEIGERSNSDVIYLPQARPQVVEDQSMQLIDHPVFAVEEMQRD